MKVFFTLFLLAHLIGDFVLQSNRIALLKSKGIKGIGVHVAIVISIQCLILGGVFGLRGLLPAILVGLIHFVIDYVKFVVAKRMYKFQTAYFLFDQGLHVASIYFVSRWLVVEGMLFEIKSFWVVYAIGLIISYYVTTIIVKYVLKDIQMIEGDGPFFLEHERQMDGITSLCLFVGFGISTMVALGIMAIGGIIYYYLQKNQFNYNRQQISIKYLVILIVTYSASLISII